ncbi:glycolate oxidase subunit GlcE [Variovorax sp. OV329]|uniref:glycolate oxidase subunit GlcE n=1 Tax=Variovorax sp. OV329 TaxID=1882825 RepID=UPI0008E12661|nr:glycolate oxidase subunit GlcE [Variovorax sp. OV329]SFN30686.1 glycolate oxidase FAD binding subunit [Variovorax sp. OV329]
MAALDDIIERIREAGAKGTPLRIRGGGSKDFYGGALAGELLDTAGHSGISNYEPSELVVTVRAGTPLAELEALLAQQGQCLPFEPPRFGLGQGTVGGMVAAGIAGPSRASVGSVRDYVLGATLVNGRGELLSFGGQVMKNVAGYDVSRVLAGSLGVLGVIAELSLKVLPVAPAEATLAFECTQADALRLLNQWGGLPLPLNASCWAEQDGQGWLYLRLRGAQAAVEAACHGLGGERGDAAEAAASWTALRDQCIPFFAERASDEELWRVSVPQTAPVLAIAGAKPPLVEWHGGQRWYRVPRGQATKVREAARAAGGHATLFAAASADAGASRNAQPFDSLSPALQKIHAALKREFDPHGIFNRGRLYADY